MRCRAAIEHLKSNKGCQLLLRKWNVVIELVKVLKSAYLATVSLQNPTFTLTDFFGCVKVLEIKLKQHITKPNRKTNLAACLTSTIKIRMEKLLQTPMMVCAMYLDPRYNCELKDDPNKIITAKLTLLNLWERLQKIKAKNTKSVDSNQLNFTVESIGSNVSDLSEGNIESYLAELDKHYADKGVQSTAETVEREISTKSKDEMMSAFQSFENFISPSRSKSSECVFKFWLDHKTKLLHGEELCQLASAIFGIPPTQAAVERLFSALNFIFTDRRYNLSQELLENILLMHTNKISVLKIFDEHLEREESKQT